MSGRRKRWIACPRRRFSGVQAMPNSSEGFSSRIRAAIRSQVPTGTWLLTMMVAPLSRWRARSFAATSKGERSTWS